MDQIREMWKHGTMTQRLFMAFAMVIASGIFILAMLRMIWGIGNELLFEGLIGIFFIIFAYLKSSMSGKAALTYILVGMCIFGYVMLQLIR